MERHFVYILQSEMDGSYYKGYTTDYQQRLVYHNLGRSNYTSTKLPWVMVYVEEWGSKTEALKREKRLKRCNSEHLKWLIDQPTNLLVG